MNNIIAIGGLSNYRCYLNVDYHDAVDRYLNAMNSDPFRDLDDPPVTYSDIRSDIRVIHFEDEFNAYDINI